MLVEEKGRRTKRAKSNKGQGRVSDLNNKKKEDKSREPKASTH